MLNKNKHKFVMVQILKDIYSDASISNLLGFKGGTAAYLFYQLPRFSVDLDFDLLDNSEEKRKLVYDKVKSIIEKYGEIKDEKNKYFTILFSLSYEKGERQLKIEINTRKTGARCEVKNFLSISMFVYDKSSILSGKLLALTKRKNFANRDLFDVYHFLNKKWEVNEEMLKNRNEKFNRKFINNCKKIVEKVSEKSILKGLGELVDEEQKSFIRNKLKKETLFLLDLYIKINNEKRL